MSGSRSRESPCTDWLAIGVGLSLAASTTAGFKTGEDILDFVIRATSCRGFAFKLAVFWASTRLVMSFGGLETTLVATGGELDISRFSFAV